MSDSLRELVARALARKRVIENIWRENRGESDEAFIWRAVDHAWRDFLPDADTALAAIEASGTHVVVPVKPTLAMVAEFARLMWHEPRLFRKTEEQVGAVYRSMLAARPRDAATGEKEGHG